MIETVQQVKLVQYKNITQAQRTDIVFMTVQSDLYQDTFDGYENNNDYKLITRALERLQDDKAAQKKRRDDQLAVTEKKLAKETASKARQLKKQTEAQAEGEKVKQYVRESLEQTDMYYLATTNKYIRYDDKAEEWITYIEHYGALETAEINYKDCLRVLMTVLRDSKRFRQKVVNTFSKNVSEDDLNLLSTDKWLQPQQGEPHVVFDILLKSLSGGDKGAQDHIEHVIAYKYLHPEDYRLPCLSIFGEGGVGKNEFVTRILGTIFGSSQVAVVSNDEAFGTYNGLMLGKTVVFIDENVTDKSNHEAMKSKVGSSKININVKYGLAGEFDNTALYMTGGNDESGSVVVTGDSTDRRWSIIHVKRNIMEWVSDHFGTGYDAKKNDDFNQSTLDVWNKDLFPILDDGHEIAKWLNYILEKWKDASRPLAYHGQAYQELLETQKSVQELCFEYVFARDNFEHIELKDLYQVYLLMVVDNRGRAANNLGKGKFKAQAVKWLREHRSDVTGGIMNIKAPMGNKTSGWIFCVSNKKTFHRNTTTYIWADEVTDKLRLEDLNMQPDIAEKYVNS